MLVDNEEQRAKQLLRFYFRRVFAAAGAAWDEEAARDIESIVPSLLDAFNQRVQKAVQQAQLTNPSLRASRIQVDPQTNLHLAQIESLKYIPANTRGGTNLPAHYLVGMTSGKVHVVAAAAGHALQALLEAESLSLAQPTEEENL